MSDEEPDYMSDAFLAQCLPQDVKPGLKRVRLFSVVLNLIFLSVCRVANTGPVSR